MTKRLLAILLALAMSLTLFSSPAAFAAEKWDGTTTTAPTLENGAYQIGTAAELAWFRDYVNSGNYTANAVLTANIDLNDKNWTTPIGGGTGLATTYFSGNFDGAGFTVSDFTLNATYNFAGFFGYLKDSVNVHDLKITDAAITSSSNYVGGIAGDIINGSINNCSFAGSVTSSKTGGYAGGIAGYMGNTNTTTPTIQNCANYGTISGSYAGGITPYAKYSAGIKNCYNTGTVTGTLTGTIRAGGIVGQLMNNTPVENCYNIGTVTAASGGTAGGITGWNGALITNCYWLTPEAGSGAGAGTTTNSAIIASAEGLLVKLGSAWVEDEDNVNNGYPILSWQASSVVIPPDTTPSLSLSGGTTIYVNSAAGANLTTLTVQKKNLDAPAVSGVTWNIEKKNGGSAQDIAALETVANTDESIVVKAVHGGVATVTASVGMGEETYSVSTDILVIPHITTAEIRNVNQPGAVAMGQTVEAKVYVLGGAEYDYTNYPALTYQWKYRPSGGTAGKINAATAKTFTIPTNYNEWDYLHLEVSCGGKVVINGSDTYQSIRSEAYGKLYPVVYDRNFALPVNKKDNTALSLPAAYQLSGINATVTWTSNNPAIIANDGTVNRPATGKTTVTLTGKFEYDGAFANRTFDVIVWSEDAVQQEIVGKEDYLEEAIASLGSWYKLTPVYGKDTNVVNILSGDLAAKAYSDITVSVKSVTQVYGNCSIADNGDISYFYADPNTTQAFWFGRYNVTFTLSKDGASMDLADVPVTIYWDTNRVKAVMMSEILDKVDDTAILGNNIDKDNIISDLVLAKVVDGKKWTQVSWTSSDPGIIFISNENQKTADTLFNPYVGKVVKGKEDKTVNLTAAFTFQYTNDVTGSESPVVLYKTFTVKVKALSQEDIDAEQAKLLEKLDAGFAAKGLRDYVTGNPLVERDGVFNASNDIKFPTTKDFGVDGKYYPITIVSSDPETIVEPGVANAARVTVYRPTVGAEPKTVTLVVTIGDVQQGISASKAFKISVQPLTQEEITAEIELMAQAKANYFNGIKNTNTSEDNITTDLHAFQEVHFDNDKNLVWAYDIKDAIGSGIAPVALDGWYDLQVWRLFKSSNPAVISHENMLVSRQQKAKAVTVNSALSSEVYGKYGELYESDKVKYAGYAELAPLYYQEVSTDLIVRGTADPTSPVPVEEKITVSFTLQSNNSTWISRISVPDLSEGSTAFDVFKKILAEKGCTYKARGSYIYAITNASGTTLEELDEGSNSGWMYKVNGSIPSSYMAAYPLKDGDNIVVFFTKDYTQERGSNMKPETTEPVKNDNGAYLVTIDSKNKASEYVKVSIPNVSGQVVVIVNPDGTETIVKKSLVKDGVAYLLLNETANIKVKDSGLKFSDVQKGDWYADAVDFAAGHELFLGTSHEKFSPNGFMTRAMLVTVLYRLEEPSGVQSANFTDVIPNTWYTDAVGWAANKEIVLGYDGSHFEPNQNISRQQLVVMLYRYATAIKLDTSKHTSLESFADSTDVDDYAEDAMSWAVASGLINGRDNGKLAPNDFVTRAEVAAIMQRLTSIIVQ